MPTTTDRSQLKTGGPAVFGAGVLMVLCCALGPGIVGAVAGAAIGGLVGIAIGCLLAAMVGLALFRRGRRRGC